MRDLDGSEGIREGSGDVGAAFFKPVTEEAMEAVPSVSMSRQRRRKGTHIDLPHASAYPGMS
jgi:hypothetical protein